MRSLPAWFKQEIPAREHEALSELIFAQKIHTVCHEALCPNINTCFKNNQLTFLILGKKCTRFCSFCHIEKYSGEGLSVDLDEPLRIAQAIKELGIKYAVITSVTRDDLIDGGAGHFARVIKNTRSLNPETKIEVLIPDFKGDHASIEVVIKAEPHIIAHNLETIKRLYPKVRPQADYKRSLKVLGLIKDINRNILTKSSLMLGMGESEEEIISVMKDLRNHGCDFLTLGQYLAPSSKHYPVVEFITPEKFKDYGSSARALGFRNVFSAPLMRSSYLAQNLSGVLNHA